MSVPVLSTRNVALCGYTLSRQDAPWGDPAWEIWPCNNLHRFLTAEQPFHRLFDLHDKATVESDEAHVEFLKTTDKPVYMQPGALRPDYPTASAFPLDTLDKLFHDEWGLFGWRYLTNSVSYMVAFAIAALVPILNDGGERPTIGLWGIDMAVGGPGQSEYAYQRPSCEYWLGVAEGLGIRVFVAERADLLKCGFRYGEETGDFVVKMRARSRELEETLAQQQAMAQQLQQQQVELQAQIHHRMGALENQRYVETVWLPSDSNPRQGADDPSMKAVEPQEA